MARFLLRGLLSTVITMLIVSLALFFLMEAGGSDVTVRILGVFSTPEQRASLSLQLGLDQPAYLRYINWLAGNDWRASRLIGYPVETIENDQTGEEEWWVNKNGQYLQWKLSSGELMTLIRQENGRTIEEPAGDVWTTVIDDQTGNEKSIFWGVDSNNNAVKWVQGEGEEVYILTKAGMRKEGDGPQQYIPLSKGLLRGDAGSSLQTGRAVMVTLLPRIRNTLVLAGVAFLIVMPLALILGIIAGVNEGKFIDRIISVTSLGFTATPEFVTGVFLILIFGIWLKWFPAVSVFLSADAIFSDPKILILPVLTLTAVELGYVVRMTRTSMVEVMRSTYIRTAIIKGLPYRRVVMKHALRNALMAPITVIMLHVNWLIGGVVVVETIFGFPGLGKYIYDSAIFGDFNAIEAAAMITVLIAVITRLLGDFAYTLLNPRIRYS
ncbi:MAG: ABC transporter permease [Anaerolineaceae bacterium]|jgi:peptide/nickel transport system permease protein|nr:ABC transporter permease [Anaerolineaceae bacterium]